MRNKLYAIKDFFPREYFNYTHPSAIFSQYFSVWM